MRFNWRVFLTIIVGMVLVVSAAGGLAVACMWMFGPKGLIIFATAVFLAVAAVIAAAWDRG